MLAISASIWVSSSASAGAISLAESVGVRNGVTDGKATGDVTTGDVTTGEMVTGNVVTVDVITGDVMTVDVMTVDVMTGDVMTGDVMTGDVITVVVTSDDVTVRVVSVVWACASPEDEVNSSTKLSSKRCASHSPTRQRAACFK